MTANPNYRTRSRIPSIGTASMSERQCATAAEIHALASHPASRSDAGGALLQAVDEL